MGQRLVVTIEKGDRKLCNIYYHWSAYTYDALLETRKIINCIYNHEDETESELLLRLIRFCEKNGGGIRGAKDEFAYIQSLYPNEIFVTENYSRSEGLIALSEKGMRDLQSWSEGDVYINLDTDEVDFCVYSGYEDFDEYIQNRKSWDNDFDETELDDIPEFDFCLGYFDVGDIDAIINSLDGLGNDEFVIVCDNEVCELIA